jgi:hypothetical protein
MPHTFIGMAIYAAVVATVGLLVTRFVRWRSVQAAPEPQSDHTPGTGCAVALALVVVAIAGVLAALWLFVGTRG